MIIFFIKDNLHKVLKN